MYLELRIGMTMRLVRNFMVEAYEPLPEVLAGMRVGYVCPDMRCRGFSIGWGQTL